MRWWRRLLGLALVGWLLLLAARCHLPRRTAAPAGDPDSTSVVYLVRHGWHAGIVVRRTDLPDGDPAASPLRSVLDAVTAPRYVEIGWGEARYYPGETRGVWGTVRAGAWPTASVLHVVPVPGPVPATFPVHTIVRIPVGPGELEALAGYLAASFASDSSGAAVPAGTGLYPGSQFYRSSLTYHVFNNCNHWAAGALEAAGCDTAPRWTFTVGQVVRQARACGALVQRRAPR
ncbi:MAG: DUF2459 domain-containing protein [Salinibacter sp.]